MRPAVLAFLHLETFADVADEDGVEPAVEPAEAGVSGGLAIGRFEEMSIEPDLIFQFEHSIAWTAGGPQERFGLGIARPDVRECSLAVQREMTEDIVETRHEKFFAVAQGARGGDGHRIRGAHSTW